MTRLDVNGKPREFQAEPDTPLLFRLAAALLAVSACQAGIAQDAAPRTFRVVGDAIPEPLTSTPGDASRGRSIVVNRQTGLCLLCHSGPFAEEPHQGNLAPSLAGAGARWSEGQLRLRLVDARRLNPATLMPSYHRVDGLVRVGAAWQNKPVLDAQQVEDVVAFLRTLRD